jgi:tetratricopeptide (TPR) repeat protein
LLEPGDLPSLVALSESYEKLGRWTDVIKVLDQQVEHTEDPAEKINLLRRVAKLWVERFNNVNNATRPLEQIVALDPTDADALAQLKDLYTKRRAWRPLFDVSRREAERLTGDAQRDALVELAKLAAEKLGANADAIGLWREALPSTRRRRARSTRSRSSPSARSDFDGLAEVLERARSGDRRRGAEGRAADEARRRVRRAHRGRGARPSTRGDACSQVQPKHAKALRVLRDAYTRPGHWDRAGGPLRGGRRRLEGLAEVLGSSADRATDPAEGWRCRFARRRSTRSARQPARVSQLRARALRRPEQRRRRHRAGADLPGGRALVAARPALRGAPQRRPRGRPLGRALVPAQAAGDLRQPPRRPRGGLPVGPARLPARAPDSSLEAQVEASAAEAGAWRELVDTFDARAASAADPLEIARLRDKSAAVEADRSARSTPPSPATSARWRSRPTTPR